MRLLCIHVQHAEGNLMHRFFSSIEWNPKIEFKSSDLRSSTFSHGVPFAKPCILY